MSSTLPAFLNMILVICLLSTLYLKRSNLMMLAILFVYASLHYAYSTMPMFLYPNSREILNELHADGSSFFTKLPGILLITIIFFSLTIDRIKVKSQRFYLSFLGVFTSLLGVYALAEMPSQTSIENLISIYCFVFIIIMSAPLLTSENINLNDNISSCFFVLMVIQNIALFVGFYELISMQAWASFVNSDDKVVYRASSIFFNPNVYGVWTLITTMFYSYAYHSNKVKKWIVCVSIIESAFAIFISGSRGAAFLLILGLLLVTVLNYKNRIYLKWVPFYLVTLSLLVICAITKLLQSISSTNDDVLSVFVLLADRFLLLVVNLISYYLGVGVPSEFSIVIQGRQIEAGETDSGWITLFNDSGWLGVSIFSGFIVYLIYKASQCYFREKSTASVYMLVYLLLFLMIGFWIRFQVYPIWMFFSVILSLCYAYWIKSDNKKVLFR